VCGIAWRLGVGILVKITEIGRKYCAKYDTAHGNWKCSWIRGVCCDLGHAEVVAQFIGRTNQTQDSEFPSKVMYYSHLIANIKSCGDM